MFKSKKARMLKDSRQNQDEGTRPAKGLWTEVVRRGWGRLLEAGMERPLRTTCKGPGWAVALPPPSCHQSPQPSERLMD